MRSCGEMRFCGGMRSCGVTDMTICGPGTRIGYRDVRRATSSKWLTRFWDPTSISDSGEDVLAHGELGLAKGLRIGPPSAWFIPSY